MHISLDDIWPSAWYIIQFHDMPINTGFFDILIALFLSMECHIQLFLVSTMLRSWKTLHSVSCLFYQTYLITNVYLYIFFSTCQWLEQYRREKTKPKGLVNPKACEIGQSERRLIRIQTYCWWENHQQSPAVQWGKQ